MNSIRKQSLAIWAASLAAIPVGGLTFSVVFGLLSQALRGVLNPHIGSLLSGVSGALITEWTPMTVLALGAFSGFALVHAFARRFRFGVGWFVVVTAILTLYPIWILSAAVFQFAGRRLWLSTGGALLLWDVALFVLGCWMVRQAKSRLE